jgi:ketosteroid isomerase-like protein
MSQEVTKFGSLARGAPPVAFLTTYDNREALREYFKDLLSNWSMIHHTMDEFVAEGDAVFARGSCAWTNKHRAQCRDAQGRFLAVSRRQSDRVLRIL